MTSKQVTSPPWNSRRLVHSKEMAWASRWSVALRAFYRQILSSSNCKDFFFKWHRPPRKLAKEVFVKFIPAKEKTRFAKEWRKVLAKDHVIRIDSHEVFNTAQLIFSNRCWLGSPIVRVIVFNQLKDKSNHRKTEKIKKIKAAWFYFEVQCTSWHFFGSKTEPWHSDAGCDDVPWYSSFLVIVLFRCSKSCWRHSSSSAAFTAAGR